MSRLDPLLFLLKKFGPQGWWPTTPRGAREPVYWPGRSFGKRTEREKFEICLGAILTQNTSWKNVARVLSALNSQKCLNLPALARMPRKRLETLIRSSGYFRQKAHRIKLFLKVVEKKYKGRVSNLLKGPLGVTRKTVLSLYGVGPETADSMLLYAGGRPVFVVDAYTRRIAARWGVLKGRESYDEIQKIFMEHLPRSPALYGEVHALLVELGKTFCRKKPLCGDCPLNRLCERRIKSWPRRIV